MCLNNFVHFRRDIPEIISENPCPNGGVLIALLKLFYLIQSHSNYFCRISSKSVMTPNLGNEKQIRSINNRLC